MKYKTFGINRFKCTIAQEQWVLLRKETYLSNGFILTKYVKGNVWLLSFLHSL